MTPPRVSVVIPVYDARTILPRAVASVLAQTESRLEIILIDDASIDGSLDVARELAASDPRIHLLRMPANGGPAAARNAGMRAATGDWIALLDTDDAFRPARLERLLALGEGQGADIVSDNLVMHEPDGSEYPLVPPADVPADTAVAAARFVDRNCDDSVGRRVSWGFMQPMFRRTFLQRHGLEHDVRNRFGEDYMLYVSCLRAGATWWLTPEPLYDYTCRAGSLTQVQRSGDLLRIVELERAYLAETSDPALRTALRRHIAKVERLYFYRAFTDALKARQVGEAALLLTRTPRSAAFIARESMRQAPVILRKVFRGGYAPGRAA